MLDNLKKYKVYLASKSPRRQELLLGLGIPFEIISFKDIDESYPLNLPTEKVAEFISLKKAKVYADNIKDDELIITADTIVVCGNEIFGKPKNTQNAIELLRKISGKVHQVITGVTIVCKGKQSSFSVRTDVEFAELVDSEIKYYVEQFRPLDKAGAYGIQEWIGYIGVKNIHGSFYNVMGLPIQRLYEELKLF